MKSIFIFISLALVSLTFQTERITINRQRRLIKNNPTFVRTQPLIGGRPVYTTPVTVRTPVVQPVLTTTTVTRPVSNIVMHPFVSNECKVSGIHKQLCLMNTDDDDLFSVPYKNRFSCFKEATCGYKGGKCQWLQTKKFKECLSKLRVNKSPLLRRIKRKNKAFRPGSELLYY